MKKSDLDDINPDEKYKVSVTYDKDPYIVEYCMDSQDMVFCKMYDIQDYNKFEMIIDILENDWQKYLESKVKNIKRIEYSNICEVCTMPNNEDDPILVCQGCSISTHRDCYGSSYSEEEFFLCQSCIYYFKECECMFCGGKNGILKLTSDFNFGHILCVIFDKSLDFDNPNSKEPIYIEDYKRNEGACYYCKLDNHTKIKCSFLSCNVVYHINCGLDKAYFDINNRISYCDKHNPLKKRNLFTSSANLQNRYLGYAKLENKPLVRKSLIMCEKQATEYFKIIRSPVQLQISTYKMLNKKQLVPEYMLELICKYWKVKREYRKRSLLSFPIIRNVI